MNNHLVQQLKKLKNAFTSIAIANHVTYLGPNHTIKIYQTWTNAYVPFEFIKHVFGIYIKYIRAISQTYPCFIILIKIIFLVLLLLSLTID